MGNAANFMGNGQGHDRNQSFEQCWYNLSLGFKFWFLSALAMIPIQMIVAPSAPGFGSPFSYFAMEGSYTVMGLQAWRLLTSVYYQPSLFGIISILFAFLWMLNVMPQMVIVE